jgi:hypothetical protein
MTCNYCKSIRKTGPNTGRCRNINSKMDHVKLIDTCKLFGKSNSFLSNVQDILYFRNTSAVFERNKGMMNIRLVDRYF